MMAIGALRHALWRRRAMRTRRLRKTLKKLRYSSGFRGSIYPKEHGKRFGEAVPDVLGT
jgi:hypothetical protein